MNNAINCLDITDTYKTLYLTTIQEHYFPAISYVSYVLLTKTDHMLGHNTNLNKLWMTKMLHGIVYDHNRIKSEAVTVRDPEMTQLFGNYFCIFTDVVLTST